LPAESFTQVILRELPEPLDTPPDVEPPQFASAQLLHPLPGFLPGLNPPFEQGETRVLRY
jgi:hypothetical protein